MIQRVIILSEENEQEISYAIQFAEGDELKGIKILLGAMGLEFRWSSSAGRYELIDERD